MSKATVNLILIVILLIIVYFGYQYFTSPATDQIPAGGAAVVAVNATTDATGSSGPADEFRQLLASISSVDFQGSHPIFSDLIFTNALYDFSQPLPIIDTGRDNPFAPLGKDALSARHQATSSQANVSPSPSPSQTPIPTTTKLPSPITSPKATITITPKPTTVVASTMPAPVRKLRFTAPTPADVIAAGQTVYFGWTSEYTSSVRDRGDLYLYRADDTKVTRPNPTWGGDSKNFALLDLSVVSGNFITRTDLPAGQYKFVLIASDGNRYDSALFSVH